MGFRRRIGLIGRVACAAAVCAAAASCSRCGGSTDASAAATTAEPPAPAPDRLVADVYASAPTATWARLQRGIGGAAGILPATAGGILCAGLGLDPSLGDEIDGHAPAYGVLAGDPADPSWALALKLTDPRRARSRLVDGDVARFTAREDAGMTELAPKGGSAGRAPRAALGITQSGYLVVARSSADLAALGPYAARTLPSRPLPEGGVVVDVSRRALVETLAPKLEALWAEAKDYLSAQDDRMRGAHGGRAPDYGDPKAIIAALDGVVTKRLEVVRDLERVRVTLDVEDDGVSALAALTPASSDGPVKKWIDAMQVGGSAELLALPRASAVALETRDAPGDRAEEARAAEATLAASLGTRIGGDDAKKLDAVVEDWTKSRGDVFALALAWDEPRYLFFRGAALDGRAADRAVSAGVSLLRVAPFKDAFGVRDVAVSSSDAPGIGPVSVAKITRGERDAGAARHASGRDGGAPKADSSVGVAWAVEGAAIDVVTGEAPAASLAAAARPERKLGDEPSVVHALAPIGEAASTILLAQPLRFDAARADLPPAPVVFAVGKKEGDAFVRLSVADGVLRQAARMAMGL